MSITSTKKHVLIKKVLPTIIGEERSDNYLKGLNFVYIDAHDIYEKSLNSLMSGETELCLKFMIFGLDYDRKYAPLLNLCRTMLFGMSDILQEGDFDTYKHKYQYLNKGKLSLMKKVDKLYNEKEGISSKVQELEIKLEDAKPQFFSLKKLYFTYKLSYKELKPIIDKYNNEIKNIDIAITGIQDEITTLQRLSNLEEYVKILKLIVEVCTVPTRFEWALN